MAVMPTVPAAAERLRADGRPPRRFNPPFLLFGTLSLLAWWQIRSLGDVRSHLAVFYGWFALAFGVYLAAIWLVRRMAHPHPRALLPISLVAFVAVLARLFALGMTPTLSNDLYRYRWDGRVQLAGIDPYAYPPNDPALAFLRDEPAAHINFPHLRTVYPPLTELAFRWGALLGGSLTAHKAVFVATELVTVLSLLFILWQRGQSPLWVVAYAWHPLAILEISGSGHNDALGVALLWLGIAAWQARAWSGCALAWAGSFLSKFSSIIMGPWWWFRREARWRLAAFLILAVLPLAAHPTAVSALMESLTAMTARVESNSSGYLLLARLLRHEGLARVVAIGAWLVFLVWWARRQADPARYLLGAMGLAALVSPVLHPWYLVWVIPCFCFWRVPALVALSGTVVLAYTVWPGYLAGGRWAIPIWAHVMEYAPVLVLGLWELRRLQLRRQAMLHCAS